MEIINTLLARSAWFIDLDLINPLGLAFGPIHEGLIQRYKFIRYPTVQSEFDLSKGIQYIYGQFTFEGKLIAVALTVYNNGLVGDTAASTDASDAFLEDLATWVGSIGFRLSKQNVRASIYESQFLIHSEKKLDKTFERLNPIVALLAEFTGDSTQEVFNISIGPDPAANANFTFERRSNVPFSENKYFSRALLPTSKHKQLLERLDAVLK